MISKIIAILALCAVFAAAMPAPAPEWAKWKSTHGKFYTSQSHEATRFAIYSGSSSFVFVGPGRAGGLCV